MNKEVLITSLVGFASLSIVVGTLWSILNTNIGLIIVCGIMGLTILSFISYLFGVATIGIYEDIKKKKKKKNRLKSVK